MIQASWLERRDVSTHKSMITPGCEAHSVSRTLTVVRQSISPTRGRVVRTRNRRIVMLTRAARRVSGGSAQAGGLLLQQFGHIGGISDSEADETIRSLRCARGELAQAAPAGAARQRRAPRKRKGTSTPLLPAAPHSKRLSSSSPPPPPPPNSLSSLRAKVARARTAPTVACTASTAASTQACAANSSPCARAGKAVSAVSASAPPADFSAVYGIIEELRLPDGPSKPMRGAPVDEIGCAQAADAVFASEGEVRNFHVLVSLILSASATDTIVCVSVAGGRTSPGDAWCHVPLRSHSHVRCMVRRTDLTCVPAVPCYIRLLLASTTWSASRRWPVA
jgi:hypothetical protein